MNCFTSKVVIHHFKCHLKNFACQKELSSIVGNNLQLNKPPLYFANREKVALMIMYCGKNYKGMQLQLQNKKVLIETIESKLFEAFKKSKVLKIDLQSEKISKTINYSSASRTDAGVSACGQVVGVELKNCHQTMELINNELPPEIRIIDIIKVKRLFHAKNWVHARTYSYTLPTFAFADTNTQCEEYRINEDKIKQVASILNKFKGTHHFHNFTSGLDMTNDKVKRYIMDFWLEKPFQHKNMEFVTLKVKGQSFLLHQIRKMIGVVIAISSGQAKIEYLEKAFRSQANLPKAPGIGLVLDEVHYDAYNRLHGSRYGNITVEKHCDKIKQFRNEFIMPEIYEAEIKNKSMKLWLENLYLHDFLENDSHYGIEYPDVNKQL